MSDDLDKIAEEAWSKIRPDGFPEENIAIIKSAIEKAIEEYFSLPDPLLGSKQCPAPENELGDSSGDASRVHIEHYFDLLDRYVLPHKFVSDKNLTSSCVKCGRNRKFHTRFAREGSSGNATDQGALTSRAAHASEDKL